MPEAREARAVGFGHATIEVGDIDTAPGQAHSNGVEGVRYRGIGGGWWLGCSRDFAVGNGGGFCMAF